MTNLTITKTLFLSATRERVWEFLVDKDKLAQWFAEGEDHVSAGGEWALLSKSPEKAGERMCWGNVVEFDPPEKLVHTFTHGFLNGVETTVSWTLVEADGGTVLTMEHSGFEKVEEGGFNMGKNHDNGWDEHFAKLRAIFK